MIFGPNTQWNVWAFNRVHESTFMGWVAGKNYVEAMKAAKRRYGQRSLIISPDFTTMRAKEQYLEMLTMQDNSQRMATERLLAELDARENLISSAGSEG